MGTDRLRARLDAIRALDPTADDTVRTLAKALGERTCHVVAAAARHAGDHGLRRLCGPMVEAYAGFAGRPGKDDPGCVAKLALVTALSALDHPDPAPFLHGVRCVQME